jgi:rSAM/selenodomain-associated transferase 1
VLLQSIVKNDKELTFIHLLIQIIMQKVMQKMMKNLLVIQFAKWPVLGNVKTRLAHDIGDEKALQVHKDLMDVVLEKLMLAQFEGIECDVQLWLNEIPENKAGMLEVINKTSANNIQFKLQKGDNLGNKMANAIVTSLQYYSKVIIVGSDCPNISTDTLAKARDALNKTDVVLGPAEDGGYVLIGASNFNESIFNNVAWGQGKVFDKTVENMNTFNFSYSLLAQSWDVDDLVDYERWCKLKLD